MGLRIEVPIAWAAMLFASVAAAMAGDTAVSGVAALGREIATANCSRCHAIDLDDTSTHKDAPPFRDVVDRYPVEHLAEALAEGIESGHPDMPVFVMSEPQIAAFLAFLNELSVRNAERQAKPPG